MAAKVDSVASKPEVKEHSTYDFRPLFFALSTILLLGGILGILSQHVSALNAIREVGVNHVHSVLLVASGIIGFTALYLCRKKEVPPPVVPQKHLQPLPQEQKQPQRAPVPTIPLLFASNAKESCVLFSDIVEGRAARYAASLQALAAHYQIKDIKAHLQELYKGQPFDFPIPLLMAEVDKVKLMDVLLMPTDKLLEQKLEAALYLPLITQSYISVRLNLIEKPSHPAAGTLGEVLHFDVARMKALPDAMMDMPYLYPLPQMKAYVDSIGATVTDREQWALKRYLCNLFPSSLLRKPLIETLSVGKINRFIQLKVFECLEWLSDAQIGDEQFDWTNDFSIERLLHIEIDTGGAQLKYKNRGRYDRLPQPVKDKINDRFPHVARTLQGVAR